MKKQMTNQSGITLIALIITVIVLLILASISITEITGDDGVLTKAHYAKQETLHANVRSKIQLAYAEYKTSIYSKGNNQTFIAFLREKGYVTESSASESRLMVSTSIPTTAIISPSLVEGMSEHGSFVISVANLAQNSTEAESTIRDMDMADDTSGNTNTTKTTEKLSSGYKINRAADDAEGNTNTTQSTEKLSSGYKVNRSPDKIKYVLKCNSTEHAEEIIWSNFNSNEQSDVLQQNATSMLTQANQEP